MYALCVECSHQRGMGNLFRSLNLAGWLSRHNQEYILLVNEDEKTTAYLQGRGIAHEYADLWDYTSGWEQEVIERHQVDTWINDRQDTALMHTEKVKESKVRLCSFDDMGSGARLNDMNFCAMRFENLDSIPGQRVYTGIEYLVLNPEIGKYRRQREKLRDIVVSLGGSDTYGVTVRVAGYLKRMGLKATIITGPCFEDGEELQRVTEGSNLEIKNSVPSLAEEFSHHDFAITGGGVTSFEACASGLPCMVIANEPHEMQVGRFLENNGCARYAGYYPEVTYEAFAAGISGVDVGGMSLRSLRLVGLDGVENVMGEIMDGK